MKSLEHLVQMANQIATFHAALPDHTEAVNGVAAHLRRFWEPRMRATLLDHLGRPGLRRRTRWSARPSTPTPTTCAPR